MYNILKIIINVTTEINLEITNFRSSACEKYFIRYAYKITKRKIYS